jgi:hypothetical protein
MYEEQLKTILAIYKEMMLWTMIFMTWFASIVIAVIISLQVLGVMEEKRDYPTQTIEADSLEVVE